MKAVVADPDRAAYGTTVLRPNARLLGPRIGKDVQTVIKAAKAGEWEQNADGSVTVAGHKLDEGEFELSLQTSDDQAAAAVRMLDPEGRSQDLGLVVALDTEVTPELDAEGVARDLIRLVQQARKTEGLDVTDRIVLTLQLPADQQAMVEPHSGTVAEAVLATKVEWSEDEQPITCKLDGKDASLRVERV